MYSYTAYLYFETIKLCKKGFGFCVHKFNLVVPVTVHWARSGPRGRFIA